MQLGRKEVSLEASGITESSVKTVDEFYFQTSMWCLSSPKTSSLGPCV